MSLASLNLLRSYFTSIAAHTGRLSVPENIVLRHAYPLMITAKIEIRFKFYITKGGVSACIALLRELFWSVKAMDRNDFFATSN